MGIMILVKKMIEHYKKHSLGYSIATIGLQINALYFAYLYVGQAFLKDIAEVEPLVILLTIPAFMAVGYLSDRKLYLTQELEERAEQLEHSNRIKDLFIDIMRHDLLNPAGTVMGMTKMALEEEEDQNKKEDLQLIFESNKRIIDMIESASTLAKLESGEEPGFEESDLGTILRSAAAEMTILADEKKMEIRINAEGKFKALVNSLIYDVFSNLISNAIKYGPEDSNVVVGIEEDGPNWKISVADNGNGIPDAHKDAIFDRFKRIEKGAVKGTGLGLTIVKRVVDLHKGRVWVEDNPDGGSIFFVTLTKY